MRTMFKLLGSLLLLCSFSWGTATVSGKLVQPDTTGTPVPSFIQFDLKNCGGNFPIVSGVAISAHEQFKLNSDGTWSQTLYKNDEVSCNGDTTSNYWHTTYYINSQPAGPSRDFRLTSSNCNTSCALDGLTPLITYPVGPIAPATVAIGTTSTLSPGSSATVTDTGTTNAAILNFGIPTGATGATGPIGPTGSGFGTSLFGFNSSGISAGASLDTGISRDSAGVFDFGNGTALDTSATLKATTLVGALDASHITSGTLPAARLPNPSASTLGGVESLTGSANNFLTGISTSGVPQQARPACANLSDAAASCNTDATNATNISSGSLAVGRIAAGTSGQCLNTSGTSTVWGSCAGTAGEQLLFVDLTNTIVNAATNSFQSVSSFTGGTGAFNTVGKTVRFHWAAIITGLNTSQAFTPEILLNGGLIAGDANCCTASAINGSARVQVNGTCSTKTTGTSGSMQCEFVVELETGGTTVIRHLSDQLATINLTTAPVFQAGGAFGTTPSTSNSINNIKFLIEQLN